MKKTILEVIVLNKKEALIAQKAGADRLELVSHFSQGGLSPSLKTIKDVCDNVVIPVNIMVRIHSNSFVYTNEELKKMISFITKIKQKTNANGIVFGSLTNKNKVNIDQLKKVVIASKKLDIIFHRAFDQITSNHIIELKKLEKCGINGILTSGTKEKAIEGKKIIKELISKAKSKKNFEILIGSGVSELNIKELIKFTKGRNFHVGTSVRKDEKPNGNLIPEKITKLKKILLEI